MIHELTNNETIRTGVFPQAGGGFVALTRSASKTFKTERGAVAWLAQRGYSADGTRS